MSKRVAVIDLGTNTFHLLIAEKVKEKINFIHRERIFVKLAERNIDMISPEAFQRGLDALMRFDQKCVEWEVKKIIAIGTAALRTAKNANAFTAVVKQKTGINVEIIPGLKEAFYIYNGVNHFTELRHEYIIMDIGGGSVEFILGNNDQIHQFESFPIGIAVLRNLKIFDDPLNESEIRIVEDFISEKLGSFLNILHNYSGATLVGASGTFEVIQNFLGSTTDLHSKAYPTKICETILDEIIYSDLNERKSNPLIPDERVDMIVFATILIKYVIKNTGVQNLLISDYALKEGVLYDHFSQA